eukprot:768298-Hanusia_phi.AAC.3
MVARPSPASIRFLGDVLWYPSSPPRKPSSRAHPPPSPAPDALCPPPAANASLVSGQAVKPGERAGMLMESVLRARAKATEREGRGKAMIHAT